MIKFFSFFLKAEYIVFHRFVHCFFSELLEEVWPQVIFVHLLQKLGFFTLFFLFQPFLSPLSLIIVLNKLHFSFKVHFLWDFFFFPPFVNVSFDLFHVLFFQSTLLLLSYFVLGFFLGRFCCNLVEKLFFVEHVFVGFALFIAHLLVQLGLNGFGILFLGESFGEFFVFIFQLFDFSDFFPDFVVWDEMGDDGGLTVDACDAFVF